MYKIDLVHITYNQRLITHLLKKNPLSAQAEDGLICDLDRDDMEWIRNALDIHPVKVDEVEGMLPLDELLGKDD